MPTMVKPTARFKAELTHQRITTQSLAVRARVSRTTVATLAAPNMEKAVSLKLAERICKVLGQPVNALFAHANGDPLGGKDGKLVAR